MKLAANLWKAISDPLGGARRAHTEERAQRQDLIAMAVRAQRDGATHGKRFGPAVAFYRQQAGRVESCFAEYNPSGKRYDWIRNRPTGGRLRPASLKARRGSRRSRAAAFEPFSASQAPGG